MIIRALMIGTVLAGLTGAAVFYGLGETSGNEFTPEAPVIEILATETPEINTAAPQEPSAQTLSESDTLVVENVTPIAPKDVAPKEIIPEIKDVAKADMSDADMADKMAEDTLKAILDEAEAAHNDAQTAHDEADINAAIKDDKAYGSGVNDGAAAETKTKNNKASETVKDMMKPRATGSFIIQEEYTPIIIGPEDDAAVAEIAEVDMSAAEELDLKTRLQDARRVSDKTARDVIYLEIFDNAVDSGSMDMAERISDKLSTPELRQLTRDIIANSVK